MKLSLRESVLATILYADIFDYPLLPEELALRLIRREDNTPHLLRFMHAVKDIRIQGKYVCLSRQRITPKSRNQKKRWAGEKWAIARRAGKILSFVPSIILVGVTGGLALDNADRKDDIDLFLITKKNTLWMSRFLTIVLMELFALRRRPDAKRVNNTICLNMFMSVDGMSMPKKERDLFAAYEIVQMKPIWEREGSYYRFLHANTWVRRVLPNAWKTKYQVSSIKYQRSKISLSKYFLNIGIWISRFYELPSRAIQLWYMKKRRTTEIITPRVLRFHPHDARAWIKEAYGARLSRYNLPLDKIFYGR